MKKFYRAIVMLMATVLLSGSIFSNDVYAANTKVKMLKQKKIGINIHDNIPVSELSNMLDGVKYSVTDRGSVSLDNGVITAKELSGKKKDWLVATQLNGRGREVKEKCTIVVENPVLLNDKIYINQDKTSKIRFTGTIFKPSSYTTDNNFVAIVNKGGKVTGVNTGTCNITTVLNRVSYNTVVTVEDPYLKEKAVIMGLEDKRLVSLLGTEQIPKWKSSKPAVATVDEFGVVESKKPGRTTVSCKINNTTYRVKVTVNKDVKTHECKFGKNQIEREATCSENGLSYSKCIYCGNISTNEIPATGHHLGAWVVDKEATCAEEGHRYRKCTVCGVIAEEESIPKREHVLSEPFTDKEPTCTEEGETCQICHLCHGKYNVEKIPALGHNLKNTVIITPNGCNVEGKQRSFCTRCNQYVEETIDKIPHVVSDKWTVTEKATCTHDGHRVKKCLLCGDVCEEETIEKTGHKFETEYDYTILKGFGIKKCIYCGTCLPKTPIDYIVAFDGNGSDLTIPSITVSYNSLARLPKVGNYVTTLNGEEGFETPTVPVVSSPNGEEKTVVTPLEGTVTPLNGNRSKFIGWNTDKDSTFGLFADHSFIYNLTHIKDKVVTLFAIFTKEENEVSDFRIVYKTELDNGFATYHTQNGKAVVGSTISPKPLDIPGYVTPDTQSLTIEKDGTNEIVYVYRKNGYAVTLSKDSGIASVSGNGVYECGENVTVKAVMKEGYDFAGWNGSLSGNQAEYSFIMPDHSVSLSASSKEKEYGITFHLNGGTVDTELPDSYKYWDGEIAIDNPVKENTTFVGWIGSCGQKPVKDLVIDTTKHRDLQYEAVYKSMFNDIEVGSKIEDEETHDEFICVDKNYNDTGYALFIMDDIVPCNGTLSSTTADKCPVFSEYSGPYKDSLLREWINDVYYNSVSGEIRDRIVPLTTEGLDDGMWLLSYNDVEEYSEFLSKRWTQEEGKWGYWTRTSYLNKATNKLSVYYAGPTGINVEDIGAKVAFLLNLEK